MWKNRCDQWKVTTINKSFCWKTSRSDTTISKLEWTRHLSLFGHGSCLTFHWNHNFCCLTFHCLTFHHAKILLTMLNPNVVINPFKIPFTPHLCRETPMKLAHKIIWTMRTKPMEITIFHHFSHDFPHFSRCVFPIFPMSQVSRASHLWDPGIPELRQTFLGEVALKAFVATIPEKKGVIIMDSWYMAKSCIVS